jgi:hypothetical protein
VRARAFNQPSHRFPGPDLNTINRKHQSQKRTRVDGLESSVPPDQLAVVPGLWCKKVLVSLVQLRPTDVVLPEDIATTTPLDILPRP